MKEKELVSLDEYTQKEVAFHSSEVKRVIAGVVDFNHRDLTPRQVDAFENMSIPTVGDIFIEEDREVYGDIVDEVVEFGSLIECLNAECDNVLNDDVAKVMKKEFFHVFNGGYYSDVHLYGDSIAEYLEITLAERGVLV